MHSAVNQLVALHVAGEQSSRHGDSSSLMFEFSSLADPCPLPWIKFADESHSITFAIVLRRLLEDGTGENEEAN